MGIFPAVDVGKWSPSRLKNSARLPFGRLVLACASLCPVIKGDTTLHSFWNTQLDSSTRENLGSEGHPDSGMVLPARGLHNPLSSV